MTIIQTGRIGNVGRTITEEFSVRLVDKTHPTLEAIQIFDPKSKGVIYIHNREMVLELMNQLELLVIEMKDDV